MNWIAWSFQSIQVCCEGSIAEKAGTASLASAHRLWQEQALRRRWQQRLLLASGWGWASVWGLAWQQAWDWESA